VVDGFRHLADVPELAPLANAVPQIAASRYAAALYPVKSMHTLLLYQDGGAGPEAERTVLECQGGELVLRYEAGRLPDGAVALCVPPTPWTKRGPDALTPLERALHHLRWFVEYRAPAV
jgi:hypothetical protein